MGTTRSDAEPLLRRRRRLGALAGALRSRRQTVAGDRTTQSRRRDGDDAAARAPERLDRRLDEVEERDRIGLDLVAELLRRDAAEIIELDERPGGVDDG